MEDSQRQERERDRTHEDIKEEGGMNGEDKEEGTKGRKTRDETETNESTRRGSE